MRSETKALFLSLLLTLLACKKNFSQSGEYLFNTRLLTVKDGLAHQEVYDVWQDSRGFMWMATRSGLSRYNGYSFTSFTKEINGLSNNSIHAIMEDDGGNLWLFSQITPSRKSKLLSVDLLHITDGAVKSLDKVFANLPFQVKDVQHYFFSDKHEIFFYAANKLWKYTTQQGFIQVPIPASFSPEGCSSDNSGIWGSYNYKYAKAGSAGNILFTVAADTIPVSLPVYMGNDFLYLFYNPKSLVYLTANRNSSSGPLLPSAFLSTGFNVMTYDPDKKQTWAAGRNTLQLFDQSGSLVYSIDNTNEALLDRAVRKIFIDKQGLAWVASEAGVLLVEVKKRKFSRYLYTSRNEKKGKPFLQCRGIFQRGNHLFVCTYDGSRRIDLMSNTVSVIPELKENGEHFGDRFTILEDKGGLFYLFAKHPIITDPVTGKELSFIKGVKRTSWSNYIDKNNRLLIGTDKGLLVYDKRVCDTVTEFTQYNRFTELSRYFVLGLIKDHSGVLWAVTSNGLYILDEEKGITAHYGTNEKGNLNLVTDNIQHLYQDTDGIYWLSTGNAGLIRWNRQTGEQKQYTKENGLSSNNLYAAYEDSRGSLWISSDYGLMRFNKTDEQVTLYSPEDGISHYEFNRISHYHAKDGRIYFGGLNGVTAFYPQDFYDSAKSSVNRVMISSFQQYVGSKGNLTDLTAELLATNKIVLNPSDKFFSLLVTVPDYMNTSKTVYQYLVEGVDKEWTKSKNNEIRFGRLPYGIHTLHIRAQMPNGNLTDEIQVRVLVKKPWYLQWWTYVLLAAIAGLAVRFFYQWRIRQLNERKKELEETVAARTLELEKDKITIEKQAEELKQLDEMKSRFFANVSHELRTPLTLLTGPINRLLQNTDPANPDYTYLQLMNQNVQQLQNRVNEILDLSKADAGKLELKETPVLLKDFLLPVVASFESIIQQKNIHFLYRYRVPESLNVLLDKEQLKKILNNLLSNAFKFTPSGGQILFIVTDNAGQIEFKVADTGEGIHPDDKEYIFNRFYQAKSDSHGLQGGTGIGLALTSELVALMKGKITVESELGKGSTFILTLPKKQVGGPLPSEIATEEVLPVVKQPVTESVYKGTAILLVEDNLSLQRYMQLELKDYHVSIANNGAEALHMLETMPELPKLVISDIMMPVMDGFELLENLKAHDHYRKLPVIMLTARADIKDKLTALRIGVDDYLVKPFISEELVARIENLLNNYHHRNDPGWLNETEEQPANGPEQPVSSRWLQQAEAAVLEYLDKQENFTLDTLAEKLFISKRQLQRNIKEETGLTPNNYIKELRLHRARHYLESKKFSTVAEVSYAVGFNDQHYFSSLFAERFGKKPSEYL